MLLPAEPDVAARFIMEPEKLRAQLAGMAEGCDIDEDKTIPKAQR